MTAKSEPQTDRFKENMPVLSQLACNLFLTLWGIAVWPPIALIPGSILLAHAFVVLGTQLGYDLFSQIVARTLDQWFRYLKTLRPLAFVTIFVLMPVIIAVSHLVFGGPIADAELRDGVLFVELPRNRGWVEIGHPNWLWLDSFITHIIRLIIAPCIVLILATSIEAKLEIVPND